MSPNYSVLISVYYKERPIYLKSALDSVLNQTLPPSEIILIKDGPLTVELEKVLSSYDTNLLKVGSINSIFYFLHKAAEPFNCLEQDNLA